MLESSQTAAGTSSAFAPSRLALSTIFSSPGGDDGSTGGSGGSSSSGVARETLVKSDPPKQDIRTDYVEATKEHPKTSPVQMVEAESNVPVKLEADATMVKPLQAQPPVAQSSCAKSEFAFPTAGPRSCSFGGGLCELMVVEAIQEYLTYHGMDESLRSLNKAVGAHEMRSIALVANSGSAGCAGEEYWGSAAGCSLVGCELSVGHALACFDSGSKDKLFEVWDMLVPVAAAKSPAGCALAIRLRVHFGVYVTRKALAALPASKIPGSEPQGASKATDAQSVPAPDFEDLKAFLASNPSANLDQSAETLAPLFALPFVPQPHTRPGFKFIFEDLWVQKLRMDLHAFLLAHATARRAPMLRHLAGALVMAKGPKSAPPPASWHELVRIADLGLAAAARVRGRQGSAVGGVRAAGARAGANFFKDMVNARCRLAAVAAKPDVPPPVLSSAQLQARALGTAAREICDSSPSKFWAQRAGSAPCLDDAIFSDISRRDLVMSPSRRPPSKRLQSARSLESRARTATALLPMPPALDFARIASAIAGKTEPGQAWQESVPGRTDSAPPLDALLQALLRRIALPDEPVRPRRTFLAAFACFGALRSLAERLAFIMNSGDLTLTELALAVLAVCACEAVGRKEIEQAEMGSARCIATLVEVLQNKTMAGPVHIQCLAVLQRLSLRRRLQSRMIAEGAIDWVLQALRNLCNPALADTNSGSLWNLGPGGDEPGAPDFMLEFASALLMNLMLHAAGRRRCIELDAYEVLLGFIEHPNAQVRTHINGTLYSLLGVPSFRALAQSRNAETSFRAAVERVPPGDDLLRKQLEYLLVQLASSGSNETDDSSNTDADQGMAADADDGDNFLDEEELAGHFLLVSSAACAATAEDAAASVAGNGGNMAVERTAADAAAVSQAAAAQAAAAENALRHFRVSPLIADAQQRLFHAFIASSCAGLGSPPFKRRGRVSLDLATSPLGIGASPITNGASALVTPSPPPLLYKALEEQSSCSGVEAESPEAPSTTDACSQPQEPPHQETSIDQAQEAAPDSTQDGPDVATHGNSADEKPVPATKPADEQPVQQRVANTGARARSHSPAPVNHTPRPKGIQQRGPASAGSRGSGFGMKNLQNKRNNKVSASAANGGGMAASKSSSGGSNGSDQRKGSNGSDQSRGSFASRANQRASSASRAPSPSLPPLAAASGKAAPNGANSERRSRSHPRSSTELSKAEAARAASTVADAAVAAGTGQRARRPSKARIGAANANANASVSAANRAAVGMDSGQKPPRTSSSMPHLPPLAAERRGT